MENYKGKNARLIQYLFCHGLFGVQQAPPASSGGIPDAVPLPKIVVKSEILLRAHLLLSVKN